MRWAGHVARIVERREVYKVLVGKPEGRRPLGRPRRRWEDGIRMNLREIGLGGVDWIRLAQDRDRWRTVVSAVMNLRVLAPRHTVLEMGRYIQQKMPVGTQLKLQSSFHEKVPAGGWLLWWYSDGQFTCGWTKGLLLVENSMTHQGVALLRNPWRYSSDEPWAG
jgi:hypothetical protein